MSSNLITCTTKRTFFAILAKGVLRVLRKEIDIEEKKMLRECSKDDLLKYADFAYELALDLTKSGYPTYCDMIKTKSMFVERLMKAFDRDDEQILLYVQNNEVHGLIHYFWISDDLYLQTGGFYIDDSTEQALEDFLIFVGEHFMGYDLFMGFPAENKKAVKFLSEYGFECIEDDFNNTAFLDRYDKLQKNDKIVQITKENYDSFRFLHNQIEGDMYWNSDRIYTALDKWIILLKESDEKPNGAVYYTNASDGWFEIFGIDINNDEYNPALFKELLDAALYDTRHRGGRVMTFFCEKEYEETALKCGFVCIGNYLLYKIHLK